jgi:hypothetical protein
MAGPVDEFGLVSVDDASFWDQVARLDPSSQGAPPAAAQQPSRAASRAVAPPQAVQQPAAPAQGFGFPDDLDAWMGRRGPAGPAKPPAARPLPPPAAPGRGVKRPNEAAGRGAGGPPPRLVPLCQHHELPCNSFVSRKGKQVCTTHTCARNRSTRVHAGHRLHRALSARPCLPQPTRTKESASGRARCRRQTAANSSCGGCARARRISVGEATLRRLYAGTMRLRRSA